MKWLLIFIVMGIDTPIYLEFNTDDECYLTGKNMQRQMKNHTNLKSLQAPYSTYVCVEQE